jgi:hypothetical protein
VILGCNPHTVGIVVDHEDEPESIGAASIGIERTQHVVEEPRISG